MRTVFARIELWYFWQSSSRLVELHVLQVLRYEHNALASDAMSDLHEMRVSSEACGITLAPRLGAKYPSKNPLKS